LRSPKSSRQWQPRQRRFDDDNFYGNTPPPMSFPSFASTISGPEVQATVKWFKADKGFGFAALADGSGDVFLHVNTLQAAGFQAVKPGTTLIVRVGNGQKGRQVDQVLSVDESTAETASRQSQSERSRPQGTSRRSVDLESAVEVVGIVKWYSADKGFGFVTPEGGGKDVFVHATALERAGMGPLQEGQSVRLAVVQGVKGPEAGSIGFV